MKKTFTLLVLFLIPVFLAAQAPVFYLTFDHMDDDDSEVNDVMNGLIGTAVGEIVSGGQYGDGYLLNGTDGFIHFEDVVINRGSFTLTTWFNVTSFEGEDPAIFQTDGVEDEGGAVFIIMYEDGMECFANPQGSELAIWAEVAPPLEGWMHLAMVVDVESGAVKVYADGELVGEAEGDYPDEADQPLIGPFTIGAHTDNGAVSRNWTGIVDDFRLYDVALTAEEIIASMDEFEAVGVKTHSSGEFRLFPNPTNGHIYLDQDFEAISVYDIAGQEQLIILDYRANEPIDTYLLGKGLYLLKTEKAGISSTAKLVIQ
jgi:hypothetical protein